MLLTQDGERPRKGAQSSDAVPPISGHSICACGFRSEQQGKGQVFGNEPIIKSMNVLEYLHMHVEKLNWIFFHNLPRNNSR